MNLSEHRFRTRAGISILAVPLGLLLASAALGQLAPVMYQVVSADVERSYLLYVPASYQGEPVPLVMSFHGSGGNPGDWLAGSGLTPIADREGFALAFPAGEFSNTVSARSWNANVEAGVNDVRFVRDLIADVSARIEIDAARIYTTGFSGGARMSSRLACELSGLLAAAAPVGGLQYPDGCTPERAIPLMAVHGTGDRVNPYELTGDARPYWRMGVETAVDRWAEAIGCPTEPAQSENAGQFEIRHWPSCDGAAEIRFYVIEDGGHVWPDWVGESIWLFFEAHSL